jgi:hypothetical protein
MHLGTIIAGGYDVFDFLAKSNIIGIVDHDGKWHRMSRYLVK